ncbi:MAG: cob(I)yrinic acid a,c-diamide adenosyltransferase [Proteobacteria bacterium]|nr:cob(I)yrinic acid a,c-diamide adenosyltransferase [Pseudomonadota bacterium]MCH9712223.1 cob(I)yrinic acid a,c-diamide adenosyltransferase [Pseudomonadota bacterium]MCH9749651.1 cob(I)yrinic acid a,c-diamide adenosyltransferase [Pseudomonadota bacterium]
MADDQYKARMQRKKEHIDQRIEEASIDKGIIVLLTGNGKGKSSSALGMICRALGYGMKIGVAKFLKGVQETGEDAFLDTQPNIQTVFMKTGFTWDTQDKAYDTAMAAETWQNAQSYLEDESIDLVVLDELTYMISYKYLDEQQILDALNKRPQDQHVVITGRTASEGLINIADTVSEVKDIKHAFRANIKAQKGVDL